MLEEGYDLPTASTYAGFKSPWMVDYLCRARIVAPTARPNPGRGRPRLFSFSDIVMLRTLRELLDRGISVKKLALEIKRNRKNFRLITEASNPFRFLVTDGRQLFFETAEKGIARVSSPNQFCFRFLVDVETARTQVLDQMASRPEIPTIKSFRRASKG